MSKFRKPFMKVLRPLWEKRFPAWRPSVSPPCFWASMDSTFFDDTALGRTGRVFHAVIEFTPKWRGAFTTDILVTSSREGFPPESNPPKRLSNDVADLPEGAYRIGAFYKGQDHWWHLVDEVAEVQRFREDILKLSDPKPLLRRKKNHWYAPSYDRPMDEIIADAASHFCEVFEQHVIPKLHRGM